MLETVRLLSDFETPHSKLMQIVLAGQPQLADKLARPALAQLRQRISILSRLSPFTPAETDAYMNHRLQVAGYKGGHLFTPEARAMIAAWSEGVPRNINNLCFNALTLGYALGRKEIDCPLVQEAANDLEIKPFVSEQHDASHLRKLTNMQVSMKEPVNVTDQVAVNSLQGAPKSQAIGEAAISTAKGPTRPQFASMRGSKLASTPASIQAAFATGSEAPSAAAPPDASWSSSSTTELIEPTAEATPQSTAPPTSSRLEQASHRMILVAAAVVVFFVVGAAGVFSLHRGPAHSPPRLLGQTLCRSRLQFQQQRAPCNACDPRAIDTAIAFASQPTSQEPLAESQPGHTRFRLLRHLRATLRSAAKIGRDEPPDLTGVASDASADAIQGVLPPSSNILPAPPLTSEQTAPVHVGGRMKEPQLVSRVLPNYPLAAKQIGLEGKVVIDAVIDTTGKVTNMKVVSGPALLQRAALDSVRKWKYEPSYLDDKPVPVEMFITVQFRLH